MYQYNYNAEHLRHTPLAQFIKQTFGSNFSSSKAAGLLLLVGCVGFNQESSALNVSELDGKNGFVIENPDTVNNKFSIPEAKVNDVNGDGVDDLVVANGTTQTHVIFGNDQNASFPANIDPTTLNGSNGFTVAGNFSGSADINGDGISDLIFTGVRFAQEFVLFGKDTQASGNFSSNISAADMDGSNGFRIADPLNAGRLTVGTQGDLSGDGIDDIVVQERTSQYVNYIDYSRSSIYVIFGGENIDFPADFSLSQLDGDNGFSIQNAFEDVSQYGFVSEFTSLGLNTRIDFNGDEIDDLYFTNTKAFEYNSAHEISVALISDLASNGDFPAQVDGLSAVRRFTTSDGSNGDFNANGNAGDINGDGIDEIAHATTRYDRPRSDSSVISFGADPSSVVQPGEKQLEFSKFVDYSGTSTQHSPTSLGDVNGDGVDDLQLINSRNSTLGVTDTYILFGRNAAQDGDFPNNIDPDYFDGTNGFIIRNDNLGSVEVLHRSADFNADGINDIVYATPNFISASGNFVGKVNVIYGRNEPFPAVISVSQIDDTDGFVIDGMAQGDNLGRSINMADVNIDGADDLIIGSNKDAYVVLGTPVRPTSPKLACLGDIDNNGTQDVAVLAKDTTSGLLNAVVKDINGTQVSSVAFNNDFDPAALKVIDDINNNQSPELVVIDKKTAKAQVRDGISGELLNTIGFNAQGGAIDIEPLADQNGNGSQALASLNDLGNVSIKDALTSAIFGQLSYSTANFVPEDLSVLDTLPAQVAVLFENKDPLKLDKVTLKDSSTGRTLKNVWYGKGWDVLQLEVMTDLNGNGSAETAVLRTKGNRVNVLIRDSKTGLLIGSQGHSTGFQPVGMAVIPDLNSNGSEEVIVLGQKEQEGNIKATIKDGRSRALIQTVYFNKNLTPLDFSVCADMNGNNNPEIVVLAKRDSNGELQLIVKDSMTGQLVGKVNY